MKTRNVGIIFRKELTDTLRDRRTLISSILLPILSGILRRMSLSWATGMILGTG